MKRKPAKNPSPKINTTRKLPGNIPPPPQMQAGFAKVCVNPPLGMAMEGLGQPEGCKTIHDDLHVYALYLTHSSGTALILGADLLFFERSHVDRFKGAIGRRWDLSPRQILLNTSHNHAGPRLTHWNYSNGVETHYLDQIEAAILQAVKMSIENVREVAVWGGKTQTKIPVCRRKPDGTGKVKWAPHHDGVICGTLPFCLLKDQGHQVVSLLYSVSCHPSMIRGLDISAEYPGAANRQLNARFHTEGSLFLQGAGGDAKPRQVAMGEERWRSGTWDEMEEVGMEIADAIEAAAQHELVPIAPDLKTAYMETQWPMQDIPPRSAFERILNNPETKKEQRLWAADIIQRLDRLGNLPRHMPVGLHALQIGKGLRLIGFEGELVGELGNLILKSYNQGITFPLGYTDGAMIYLPSSRMIEEEGYEVSSYWEYHHPAPLAAQCDAVVKTALDHLKKNGPIQNTQD
ncbi:MAG: hypothetical protein PHV34_09340 [Verrucomicrobiae bacterium]|nr:hypothetical protein [Verrucomicrobiae bacterium]